MYEMGVEWALPKSNSSKPACFSRLFLSLEQQNKRLLAFRSVCVSGERRKYGFIRQMEFETFVPSQSFDNRHNCYPDDCCYLHDVGSGCELGGLP